MTRFPRSRHFDYKDAGFSESATQRQATTPEDLVLNIPIWSTVSHAIHFKFDISANASEIGAVPSLKCIV
jgi:hypothetical protein